MDRSESALEKVQRWMQAVIMHPQGVEAGLDSAAARNHIDVPPEQVERVISPSEAQSSIERLSIYANAYYARLLECLGEEFPILKQTLGEETFQSFAFAYLQTYPSRSYTLNLLGENFPAFLAETRPGSEEEPHSGDEHPENARSEDGGSEDGGSEDGGSEDGGSEDGGSENDGPGDGGSQAAGGDTLSPDWPDFLIDLATLEWTFSQVFDGPGVEGEPLVEATELRTIGLDRWPAARLETVPCLKLIELRFPVNGYYSAARRGEQPPIPAPEASWLAVSRREYIVRRHELSRPQFVLLSALIAGQPIGAAIERLMELPDIDVEALAGQLHTWFHNWAAEGFFRRVWTED